MYLSGPYSRMRLRILRTALPDLEVYQGLHHGAHDEGVLAAPGFKWSCSVHGDRRKIDTEPKGAYPAFGRSVDPTRSTP